MIIETKIKMIMKKTLLLKITLAALAGGILFNSCEKEEQELFDKDFVGIYFHMDSIYYSFGVTPLDIQSYDLKVPVSIMGKPQHVDRIFSAEVIADKTTAAAGEHYSLTNEFVVKKDSIYGYITMRINRVRLGTNDYKVCFKLLEKNGFVPVNEPYKTAVVHFNNRVEKPNWKDWNNKPTWPTNQLGNWNPLTYIKFIELFRAMEQKAPETYAVMVKLYGKDLEHVTYGWPWDYNQTMIKYTLIPLYQYFVEQHPELGVVIPRPSGY
ncbi:hypothetical protein Solca_0988 [Solitalea canadensis DSM 3403]|uniref:DUF4843 domain-containing protein n=2 Tax=Solitalea canadensis TaxID=995 RepID=H8KPY9_SOLCM|nr:hypothetical protein Solca_0988 [Solitalea canadensis DSM 3403]